MMRPQEEDEDHQSKMLYELSSLVMNILKSPQTQIDFSEGGGSSGARSRRRRRGGELQQQQQITASGFAFLLLGISVSLMLCGSVTFLIGFMMMPWVLGLLVVFYVVGIVSTLSMLGRAILCYTPSPKNHCSSWKLL